MKKIFLIILTAGTILLITNPSKDKFAEFASKKLLKSTSEELSQNICEGDKLCENWYNSLSTVPQPIIESAIRSITKQDDYKIFSIYTTEIPGLKVTTVGALNYFQFISKKTDFSANL